MSVITINNLKKYYGSSRGLEKADFGVELGEIFGFIGPNGAGKTTLIRLLLGLIRPTSGSATIRGLEVKTNFARLNNEIGYLPGETFFFPELKGGEVIRFFQEMYKTDSLRADELVDILKLDITKKVQEYSFGNRKKLGIIIAMMHRPKILILDEPTSGLDPLMQQIFLNLLLEEKREGVTIFLSSHVLSEIEKVCDRIALIKDGVVGSVFSMQEFHRENRKKIILRPALEQIDLESLVLVKTENGNGHYDYQGDINQLIGYLAKRQFTDIRIRDASLEEIFIDYYKEGN